MNSLAPQGMRNRLPVGWSFVDMVLVVVASFGMAILLGVALGVAFQLLGLSGVLDYIRDHPVLVSAIASGAVYGLLLAAVYVLIVRRRNVGWDAIGFRRLSLRSLVLAPLIAGAQLSAGALTNLLVISLIGQFENPQIAAISGGQDFSWLNFGLMLLLAGGIVPLVEEVLFRGLLYGWLRARMPIFLAVIISAGIFAVGHVIPVLVPALFVIGIILALAYEFSGSLWLPLLLHSIQNSLAVTIIFSALAYDIPVSG